MIELDRADGLWTVTLNRPGKANALTRAMLLRLAGIAEAAHGEARALILTGTGTAFSAGADLAEARAGLSTDPVWERLSAALADLPCLSIAALNGTLAGGAMGMALACDLRLAVPTAKIFYPVMKLGFLPQPSDPGRLRALVSPARAKLILMSGARIGAEQALTFGLIDEIAEPDILMQRARDLCRDPLCAMPGHAAAIKAMI